MFLRRYLLVLAIGCSVSAAWGAISTWAGVGQTWSLVGMCAIVAVGTLYSVTYYVKLSEEGER